MKICHRTSMKLKYIAGVAVFLLPTLLCGGQSVTLGSGVLTTSTKSHVTSSQSWRLEFQLHDFSAAPAGNYGQKIFYLNSIGTFATVYPDGSINLADLWDLGEGGAPCQVSTQGFSNVLVRIQRNVDTKNFTCELWNYDANGYTYQIRAFGVARNFTPGLDVDSVSGGASGNLGFLRISTTVLPLGSKPPTTADSGDWTEWKFDGNLADSSGHNRNLGGPAVFVPTPNQAAFALAKTYGSPAWTNWVSLRAGYPAQLDGRASYSLADASSQVSYFWQLQDGPSYVRFNNRTSSTPTIRGLIFGTYHFILRVTDAAGSSSTSILEAGAVATDDNGVVINADPNVDKIFGPMIAYGRNPWGFADERAMSATRLRAAAYQAQGLNPPSWETPSAGTVSYWYKDANGLSVGVLAAAIPDAAATTIQVQDASKIDLSSLPVRVLLGPPYGRREDVRICGASALSGPATLTVCYDGRGQANPQGESYRTSAQAWPAGTQVWQMRVSGTGTNFYSKLCPAGPGPGGPIVYQTGSVVLSPGSAVVTGIQTAWSAANGVYPNNTIVRVTSTHQGTPFVFAAYVSTLTDSSHLSLSRAYPADADGGIFSYTILQADTRYATLHYTRTTDGSDAQVLYQIAGCESPTDLYTVFGRDLGSVTGPAFQSGKQYSYMDGLSYASAFGSNFYGEDLAHRALYYRSGWTPALQAARAMGDYYVRAPVLSGGDAGGIPLLIGGGVIGGFASAVLDSDHPGHTQWSDLRGYARWGSIGQTGCSYGDTRDTSYMSSWLALAAAFDPDPTQRATWKSKLASIYDREVKCKQADTSWAQGFLWNQQYGPLTMTNGSTVVQGNNLPQSMCFGISAGNISVTNGSGIAIPADNALVAGNKIVINGTMGGASYVAFFEFHINSDGTATLGALWPGDSGTFSYVIDNSDNKITIGTGNDDPQLKREWACTWNGPGRVTLNRPWDGPTENNAYAWQGGLAGYGQQPFMMGIKVTELRYGALSDDPVLAANMLTLAGQAAGWVHDTGYDPVTQGMHYGRVFQACEPQTTPPPGKAYVSRSPFCDNGYDPGSLRGARVLSAETSSALRAYYEASPSPGRKTWGDTVYGSIWGNANFTTGNVYTDSNYVRDENSNNSLGAYKWTGFFFGMGMVHQWPAVRLGGVMPPQPRRVPITLSQGTGGSAVITITSPSGAAVEYTCSVSQACTVQVDDRQGEHWFRIRYLSGNKVVALSEPDLLNVP